MGKTVSPPRSLSDGEIPDRNPKKFGSGNGANTHEDFLFKSFFLKNTRFNREKTVQFRSVRKCAKTGQPAVCSGIRRPPDDRYGLKIKGIPSGAGKRPLFPEK